MNITPTFRRFHLQRSEDVSGVSGVGRVAEGCIFSDGTVVVRWLSACPSSNFYNNWDGVMQVHGHGGTTEVVFDDPDPRTEAEQKHQEQKAQEQVEQEPAKKRRPRKSKTAS